MERHRKLQSPIAKRGMFLSRMTCGMINRMRKLPGTKHSLGLLDQIVSAYVVSCVCCGFVMKLVAVLESRSASAQ